MSTIHQPAPAAQFGTFSSSITALAISSDGLSFAVGTRDNFLSIWDISTAELIMSIQLVAFARAIVFSDDGAFFAASLHNGDICVWTYQGHLLTTLQNEITTTLTFLPQTSLLAFAAPDGSLQIINTTPNVSYNVLDKAFKERLTFPIAGRRFFEVACSSDGAQLICDTDSKQGRVGIWNVKRNKGQISCDASASFSRMKAHYFGEGKYRPLTHQYFFLAQKRLCGFDTDTLIPVETIGSPGVNPMNFCFSPHGNKVAYSDFDGGISLWDIEQQMLLSQFDATGGGDCAYDDAAIQCILWHPQLDMLLTGGVKKKDGSFQTSIKLWSITVK